MKVLLNVRCKGILVFTMLILLSISCAPEEFELTLIATPDVTIEIGETIRVIADGTFPENGTTWSEDGSEVSSCNGNDSCAFTKSSATSITIRVDAGTPEEDSGDDEIGGTVNGIFGGLNELGSGKPDKVSKSITLTWGNDSNDGGTTTTSTTTTTIPTATLPIKKNIFVTSSAFQGNLGGITGADTLCEADSNKPDSNTYRAMIVDGSNRTTSTDWVLQNNTSYYQADGNTIIGTTDSSGVLSFPLDNVIDSLGERSWTGLTTNWGVSSNICQQWSNNKSSKQGAIGDPNQTSSLVIHSKDNERCNRFRALYCVEQ